MLFVIKLDASQWDWLLGVRWSGIAWHNLMISFTSGNLDME